MSVSVSVDVHVHVCRCARTAIQPTISTPRPPPDGATITTVSEKAKSLPHDRKYDVRLLTYNNVVVFNIVPSPSMSYELINQCSDCEPLEASSV